MTDNGLLRCESIEYKDGLIVDSFSCPVAALVSTAVVLFHGGGWFAGDQKMLEPQARFFASRGLDAYCVQYRTFKRFGATPFDALNDSYSAVDYLIRTRLRPRGQNRLVLLGASAGGLLALMVSQKINVDALILFNPVTDLTETGFSNKVTRLLDSVSLREISPLHAITAPSLPSTIIFHGDSDKIVPLSASIEFKKRMNAVGNQVMLVPFKNMGHGFFNYSLYSDQNKSFMETLTSAEKFLEGVLNKRNLDGNSS